MNLIFLFFTTSGFSQLLVSPLPVFTTSGFSTSGFPQLPIFSNFWFRPEPEVVWEKSPKNSTKLHSSMITPDIGLNFLPKDEISFEHLRVFSWTILKIFSRLTASRNSVKLFSNIPLKCSQLISSSDNKKILLTTRNVRLDSGRYATKYYFQPKTT